MQIDLDGRMLAIRYPMDVALVGDILKQSFKGMVDRLTPKKD